MYKDNKKSFDEKVAIFSQNVKKRTLQRLSIILKKSKEFSRVTLAENAISFDYKGKQYTFTKENGNTYLERYQNGKMKLVWLWTVIPYKLKNIKYFIEKY